MCHFVSAGLFAGTICTGGETEQRTAWSKWEQHFSIK